MNIYKVTFRPYATVRYAVAESTLQAASDASRALRKIQADAEFTDIRIQSIEYIGEALPNSEVSS